MAITQNLGNPSEPQDMPLHTHNRTNAGEPNGSLTPVANGEIVLDTTNNQYWKAMGAANNTWVALTP